MPFAGASLLTLKTLGGLALFSLFASVVCISVFFAFLFLLDWLASDEGVVEGVFSLQLEEGGVTILCSGENGAYSRLRYPTGHNRIDIYYDAINPSLGWVKWSKRGVGGYFEIEAHIPKSEHGSIFHR